MRVQMYKLIFKSTKHQRTPTMKLRSRAIDDITQYMETLLYHVYTPCHKTNFLMIKWSRSWESHVVLYLKFHVCNSTFCFHSPFVLSFISLYLKQSLLLFYLIGSLYSKVWRDIRLDRKHSFLLSFASYPKWIKSDATCRYISFYSFIHSFWYNRNRIMTHKHFINTFFSFSYGRIKKCSYCC